MARYGGNTSCLEVQCGDRRLIFDAGTGLRPLGEDIVANMENGADIDLFLSHCHYDHIIGLPFFAPFFRPDANGHIWAGHLLPDNRIQSMLSDMMAAPLLPITLDIFNADLQFHDFTAGDTLDIGDGIILRTAPLNHPNGATGYRVDFDGRSFCYVTDTEHVSGAPDQNILGLIEGADAFAYDATYADAQYRGETGISHVGWGHSTWEEGLRLSDAANVGTYVIFHHDPSHDDDHMDGVAREAEAARPGTVVARDGMVLDL
ncbi:MAG: MBL fold metallo-hydrolase [Proteobacteria bacterium]|nr:MBL fold metallo-hydrolase [Pseudomonadota bacterium]